ncbi:MAG: FAD-dependent oxidoreductase [Planctomycetota bacterium]
MREIEAQHLVIGGGPIGLATADHLLRRGAEGVVVLERGQTPGQARRGAPGFLLSSPHPDHVELGARSHLLLEEWPEYLEIDPRFRCSGSLNLDPSEPLPGDWENLATDDPRRRHGPVETNGRVAFAPKDGVVDPSELTSALHWQVRKRGGRVLTDCAVDRLSLKGERVAFDAIRRSGSARKVYLTAGASIPLLIRTLGVETGVERTFATWQRMTLHGPPLDFGLIRAWRTLAEDSSDVGLDLLEGFGEAEATGAWPGETQVLLMHADGRIEFSAWVPSGPQPGEIPVDWTLWERARGEFVDAVPALADATVRSGSAELVLQPSGVGDVSIESLCDGRVLVAPALGAGGLFYSLSIGERLAEAGLQG